MVCIVSGRTVLMSITSLPANFPFRMPVRAAIDGFAGGVVQQHDNDHIAAFDKRCRR